MQTSNYGCIEITSNAITKLWHSLTGTLAKSIFDKIK